MRDGGAKGYELSRQGAGHHPAGQTRGVRCNVPQLRQQAVGCRLTVDFAAFNGKPDQKTLLVFNNFGLGGFNLEVAHSPGPDIFNPQTERKRNRRFDIQSKSVITVNLGRNKIIKRQFRHRLDVDIIRGHLGDVLLTADIIGQGRTDIIKLALGPGISRPGYWNNQPMYVSRSGGLDRTLAVDVAYIFHGIDTDKEPGARRIRINIRIKAGDNRIAVLICKVHHDLHMIQGDIGKAVINPHMGIKGLALQGQFLLDFNFNLSAQGISCRG